MLTDTRPFDSDWDDCFVPELRSSLADHPFAHSQFRSPSPAFPLPIRLASDIPLPKMDPVRERVPPGLHTSSVSQTVSVHSQSSVHNSNEGLWTPLLKMYYDDSATLIANYPVGKDNLAIVNDHEDAPEPITPHRPPRPPLATISRQTSKKKSPHKRFVLHLLLLPRMLYSFYVDISSATYGGTSNIYPEPSSRKAGTALRSYRLVDDWLHTVGISTASGAVGLKRSFAMRSRNRSATFDGVPSRDQPLTPAQADDWAYIYAGHSSEDLR